MRFMNTNTKPNTCAASSAAFSSCASKSAFDTAVLSVRDTAVAVSLFVFLVVAVSIVGILALFAVRIMNLPVAVILFVVSIMALVILVRDAARFTRLPTLK